MSQKPEVSLKVKNLDPGKKSIKTLLKNGLNL